MPRAPQRSWKAGGSTPLKPPSTHHFPEKGGPRDTIKDGTA
ncbi:hypothetical protein HMPREF3038_00159 [Akkermansia sp. KLE1797]|nr:hypothetical protein HMPREF3038_00159 [Akkermansia sp. KLE1797]KZA05214.1 hypothetical protein HMPREF1326_01099 [Akkermansia sp. KLE1605]